MSPFSWNKLTEGDLSLSARADRAFEVKTAVASQSHYLVITRFPAVGNPFNIDSDELRADRESVALDV